MVNRETSEVLQHLRRAALRHDGAGLTDGQLLECFLTQGDEAAFAALVRRHGPMVWGVCRRVLHHHHDAEDAFQATFLVLVRKAASVEPKELVANWLYGVAYQTALKARSVAARRKGRERQVAALPEPAVPEPDAWADLRPLLDQELSRLPPRYRAPVVLCDLEGKTRREAAQQLGWPEGTVAGRLATGRKMLARRLARRGVVLSGGALATLLGHATASAGVTSAVVSATVRAATGLAAGQVAVTGLVSVQVAALTEGVLKAMWLTKLKTALALAIAMILLGGAGGLVSHAQDAGAPAAAPRTITRNDPPPLKDFLITLDKQLWHAATKGDWQVYQTLIADDYLGFSSLYGRSDKATTVAAVRRRRYSDWVIREVEFRRVSKDVAILSYLYDCTVREGEATQRYHDHRASFTWVQRGGVWVLVFSHDTSPPEREPDERAVGAEAKAGVPDRAKAEPRRLYHQSVGSASKQWATRLAEEAQRTLMPK